MHKETFAGTPPRLGKSACGQMDRYVITVRRVVKSVKAWTATTLLLCETEGCVKQSETEGCVRQRAV